MIQPLQLPALDERLALIASLVRPGRVVADIGADHGYLAAWLVASGRCPRAIASDLREMPLASSRETIARFGVSDRVRLVLSDGLAQLSPDDADDLVIAGMGGDLIAQILERGAWNDPDKRWLLQPMTRASHLRRWLCEAGYCLLNEHAVHAGHFWYTVMTVQYTGQVSVCDELFATVGLLANQDSAAASGYLRWQAEVAHKRASGLQRAKDHAEQAEAAFRLRDAILELLPSAERSQWE